MVNKQTDDLQKTYQKKIDEQMGNESQNQSQEESLGVEQLPQSELEAIPGETEQDDRSNSANAG